MSGILKLATVVCFQRNFLSYNMSNHRSRYLLSFLSTGDSTCCEKSQTIRRINGKNKNLPVN